jgi:transcriptional regulator with XRE-family HTH domain
MPRTRAAKNITPPEGCWIRYQLNLRNIKMEDIAKKAGCSIPTVSEVINGVKNSKRVAKTLADMLGYTGFEALLAAASAQARGGAA